MSELVEGEYRDTWTDRVIFVCGDTRVEVTLTFKQWGKLFIAFDSTWRGQGQSREEAALAYLRQRLGHRDS